MNVVKCPSLPKSFSKQQGCLTSNDHLQRSTTDTANLTLPDMSPFHRYWQPGTTLLSLRVSPIPKVTQKTSESPTYHCRNQDSDAAVSATWLFHRQNQLTCHQQLSPKYVYFPLCNPLDSYNNCIATCIIPIIIQQ